MTKNKKPRWLTIGVLDFKSEARSKSGLSATSANGCQANQGNCSWCWNWWQEIEAFRKVWLLLSRAVHLDCNVAIKSQGKRVGCSDEIRNINHEVTQHDLQVGISSGLVHHVVWIS